MKRLLVLTPLLAALSVTAYAHPPLQRCPDGEWVYVGRLCPVRKPKPAPTPTPTPTPPTTLPQWTPTALGATPYARATKTCSSIYRSAESDRNGVVEYGVVAGHIYNVPTYTQVPATTALPYIAGWSYQVAVNIDGQTGASWTVLDNNAPIDWYAVVSTACLEGVRPV